MGGEGNHFIRNRKWNTAGCGAVTGASFKPWVSSSLSTFITALTGKQESEEALGQGRTVFPTGIIDSNALDICQQVEKTDGAQIQPLGVSLICRDLTTVLRVFVPPVGRRQQHGTGWSCPNQPIPGSLGDCKHPPTRACQGGEEKGKEEGRSPGNSQGATLTEHQTLLLDKVLVSLLGRNWRFFSLVTTCLLNSQGP